MPPLVSFPIDLSRTAAALESITAQLSRITAALERIAPALPESGGGYVAGLSDLRHTDQESIARIKDELRLFAENNNVVVDSDTFVKSIIEYERQVVEAYGPEAIHDLPWNKAAGGPIFASHAHPGGREREAAAGTQRS